MVIHCACICARDPFPPLRPPPPAQGVHLTPFLSRSRAHPGRAGRRHQGGPPAPFVLSLHLSPLKLTPSLPLVLSPSLPHVLSPSLCHHVAQHRLGAGPSLADTGELMCLCSVCMLRMHLCGKAQMTDFMGKDRRIQDQTEG